MPSIQRSIELLKDSKRENSDNAPSTKRMRTRSDWILHGVTYFAQMKSLRKPFVVFGIGEKHGLQTCGRSDYVSAYKHMLATNEKNKQLSIDIFIEAHNYDEPDEDYTATEWMGRLKYEFQDCYLYYRKCPYKNVRFHWTEPIVHYGSTNWMMDLNHFPHWAPENWKDEFNNIAQHIKTKDDLIKIILEDTYIYKQGERCVLTNWKDFVIEQFNKLIEPTLTDENDWWRVGIYDTYRFKNDIYTILRMLRSKDDRFHNVIYHAGEWHIRNLASMLQDLNYNRDIEKSSDKDCLAVNLTHFLDEMNNEAPQVTRTTYEKDSFWKQTDDEKYEYRTINGELEVRDITKNS